eukprot:TRINITY_DN12805_c0_g3_i1.p4 TRINITY_DN12805_c0_g3~~TRINITY_DN12805_c0_g3_i1.p4  ORF type:complete len:121 (+),score=48.99 TRINITY_DN12805_c0_g3_i1:1185-1547(+)
MILLDCLKSLKLIIVDNKKHDGTKLAEAIDAFFAEVQAELTKRKAAGGPEAAEAYLTRLIVAEKMRIFRVTKCWNPSLTKLEMCGVPGAAKDLQEELMQYLCKVAKGQLKVGSRALAGKA